MRLLSELISLGEMADKTGFALLPSLLRTLAALLLMSFFIRKPKTQFNMYTTEMKFDHANNPKNGKCQWRITGLTTEEVEHIRLSILSTILEGEAVIADPAQINRAFSESGKELAERFDFVALPTISFEDPEMIEIYRERNELLRPLADLFDGSTTEIKGLSTEGIEAIQFSLHTGFVEASLMASVDQEMRVEIFRNLSTFFNSHNLKGMDHLPQDASVEYWLHRKEVVEALLKVELYEMA